MLYRKRTLLLIFTIAILGVFSGCSQQPATKAPSA